MEDIPNVTDHIQEVIQYYHKLVTYDIIDFAKNKQTLVLPTLPPKEILWLLKNVKDIFAEESIVMKITGKIVVVGDLHGHILDLFRILKKFGFPPFTNYLFLGDIVDRGDFSTETVVLLYIFKFLYPRNVFIIRGNHEFADVCKLGGFSSELESLYHCEGIEQAFFDVFSFTPLAAVYDRSIFFVHGGLGPDFINIGQLLSIQRPITTFNNAIITALLWSDPSEIENGYQNSQRGMGYNFGVTALNEFLENNTISLVVRGHECVNNGIEKQLQKKLITVFSASNYCNMSQNSGAVMIIYEDMRKEFSFFTPIDHPSRTQASFFFPDNRSQKRKGQAIEIRTESSLPFLQSGSLSIYSPKKLSMTDSAPLKKPKRPWKCNENISNLAKPIYK